ncbi:MAG: metallopeptidase TldD-related protein [Bacilli bacterium]
MVEKWEWKAQDLGRREDYLYAPTSRMNNTYLASGNDSFEDMVASIGYGFYCKNLNGGLVSQGQVILILMCQKRF